MIKVTLIVLGKLKESYLRDACAEYEKRLSAFCKLDVVELNPVKLSDNPSDAQINDALEKESAEILRRIPQSSKVYSLCIEGKMLSSEKLSEEISLSAVSGSGNITFIIGSSFGLSPKVKQRSDVRLSMSPMTFPHQLARVMLFEQIYRAFQIMSGGKYHK